MPPYRSYLLLLFVQLCFGFLPLASKVLLRELSPEAFMVARMSGGTLLFFLVTYFYKHRLLPKSPRQFLPLALCGIIGIALNPLFFVRGLQHTTTVVTSLCQMLTPIFTILIATLSGVEKFRRGLFFGLLLALGGVGVLFHERPLEWNSGFIIGYIYLILNTLSFGIYLVMSRFTLAHDEALINISWIFFFGTATLALILFASGAPPQLLPHTGRGVAALAYTIIFPTFCTYLINLRVMRRVDSSLVGLFIYVQPLVAGAVGYWVLGESLTPGYGVALGLIFAGLAASEWHAWGRALLKK